MPGAVRGHGRLDGRSFGTLVPHVGSQRRDWNAIMIDGVLGRIGQANRMAQRINIDACLDQVLLNTYPPVSRTGAHGADRQQSRDVAFAGGAYYRRNERLSANNFFNNSWAAGDAFNT